MRQALKIECPPPKTVTRAFERRVEVRGRAYRLLGHGEHLWLLVNPRLVPDHYWPRTEKADLALGPDHSFAGVAYLGGKTGEWFDIVAVVVNDVVNRKFTEWVSEGRRTGKWPTVTEAGHPWTVPAAEVCSWVRDKVTVAQMGP